MSKRDKSSTASRFRSQAKWLLPLLAVILTVTTLWIGASLYRMFGPAAASSARPPSGKEWDRAYQIAAQLHENERFKLVSVLVDLENPSALIFNGEVPTRADLTALRDRLQELGVVDNVRIEVEPLRP